MNKISETILNDLAFYLVCSSSNRAYYGVFYKYAEIVQEELSEDLLKYIDLYKDCFVSKIEDISETFEYEFVLRITQLAVLKNKDKLTYCENKKLINILVYLSLNTNAKMFFMKEFINHLYINLNK